MTYYTCESLESIPDDPGIWSQKTNTNLVADDLKRSLESYKWATQKALYGY